MENLTSPAAPVDPAKAASMTKSDLHYEADFSPTISRWFVFRFLWIYVEIFVLMVWSMWMGIVNFIHFWYMLFLGKRNKTMWEKMERFMRHTAKWQSYFMAQTDKRPKLIED